MQCKGFFFPSYLHTPGPADLFWYIKHCVKHHEKTHDYPLTSVLSVELAVHLGLLRDVKLRFTAKAAKSHLPPRDTICRVFCTGVSP